MSKVRYILLVALVVLLAGCVKNTNPQVKGEKTENQSAVFHRSYYLDQNFFDKNYQAVEARSVSQRVLGGIIPHHLLASHLIAEFFEGLEQFNQPEVVVLIGPNHKEVGNCNILTSRAQWITPYGNLEPDTEIISTLEKAGILRVEEKAFAAEHSISAEVSFIKSSFPRAKLVPIILKTRVNEKEAQQLAQTLFEIIPEKSLVLASVDFAHEVTSEEADQLDAHSIAILQSFDFPKIYEMTVDSKPTIRTLLDYLNQKGATESMLLKNSNAARVVSDLSIPEVTSYITMYFL